MAEVSAPGDVASDVLVSELVFDILSNVASFLPRNQLVNIFTVCRAWAKQADSEILWKSLIERHYGPHCLVPCDSWKKLYRQIVNNKFSIFDFGIVHFDPQNPETGPYWRRKQSSSSRFGCIAKLNQVCWLEFGGPLAAEKIAVGCYDVLWRMHLPTQDSSNFDCSWEVSVKTATGDEVSATSWKTVKRDPIWQLVVEKGWFLFNIGSIDVTSIDQVITVHAIGGNSWWFSNLELDCLVLRPVLKASMNERQGFIETNDQIIHPPKPNEVKPAETDPEDDGNYWGHAGDYFDNENGASDDEDAEEDRGGDGVDDGAPEHDILPEDSEEDASNEKVANSSCAIM